jgi:3-hydroxyisobutyrate dehydrogenase-like beta-hydroxyacid dehydrogenase
MRVGWIGLGEIGAPMAARLADAGHDLTVWNRTPARMEPLAQRGVATATSAAALADAVDVVLTCIDTPHGLDEVLLGTAGVTAARRPPRVVVDHSTMHPDVTVRQGAALAVHGIALVDAPVSGGPRGAEAGTLAIFAGGPSATVDLVRPLLSAYSARVSHLGPLGSGNVGKLCNQVINFATMSAIAEATALGASYGLDDRALPAAMAGGLADSAMLREYDRGRRAGESDSITGIVNGLRQLLRGVTDYPTGGRLDILLKDLGAALDVARTAGCAMPVSALLEGLYRTQLNQEAPRSHPHGGPADRRCRAPHPDDEDHSSSPGDRR